MYCDGRRQAELHAARRSFEEGKVRLLHTALGDREEAETVCAAAAAAPAVAAAAAVAVPLLWPWPPPLPPFGR